MSAPQGTIAEVLDWVGNDPARAREALDAEYAGPNRSTLISQLEAIASATQEDPMTAPGANETLPAQGDPEALAPGPEPPVEITINPEDVTFSTPTHVRDADVEVPEGQELVPADALQVESLGAAGAPYGFILVINGSDAYAFNSQMVAVLKQIADKAVAGVVL